jgi:hypothetical protein
MKKSLLIAALVLSVVAANARDYKHSLGVNVGSLYGITYKGYVGDNDHFVFQMDANVQLGATGKCSGWLTDSKGNSTKAQKMEGFSFYAFAVNPNLMFQGDVADWSAASMHWFIGGGIELGFMWDQTNYGTIKVTNHDIWGKVNEHLLTGIEFDFKAAPLNLALDLRPGVGEAFYIYDDGSNATVLFFDWGANVSLRYRF